MTFTNTTALSLLLERAKAVCKYEGIEIFEDPGGKSLFPVLQRKCLSTSDCVFYLKHGVILQPITITAEVAEDHRAFNKLLEISIRNFLEVIDSGNTDMIYGLPKRIYKEGE